MMSHRTTSRRRTARAGQAPAPPSRYAEISARVVIGVYSFAALLTTFAWILSPLRHGRGFTWWEVTADLLNIPSTHTLPSAITMIVLVSGLIVRKRAALIAAIVFQVLGALIATHSAFTLVFPAGIMPKDRIFSSTVDTLSIVLRVRWCLSFSRFVRRSRRVLVASRGWVRRRRLLAVSC